jgi:hypothetical protein
MLLGNDVKQDDLKMHNDDDEMCLKTDFYSWKEKFTLSISFKTYRFHYYRFSEFRDKLNP